MVHTNNTLNSHLSLLSQEHQTLHFHLQVKTKLEALKEILPWFDHTVKPLLGEKCAWQCQLLLVEAFTNAVRHAHQNLPAQTPIDLEATLDANYLEMRIIDRGQPFDLTAELARRLTQKQDTCGKVEALAEGGRGLIWIQELADRLDYIRLPNQRNCLIMGKNLANGGKTPHPV